MTGAGVDVVGLLQFCGHLRAATGALVHGDCGLDRAMAGFGRGLFVDRHRNLAGGAHPLGGGDACLNVGDGGQLRAEPRLGAESGTVLGGVRGDGGEGDYGDDTECFVHDYFLLCCRRGGAASSSNTSAVGKPLAERTDRWTAAVCPSWATISTKRAIVRDFTHLRRFPEQSVIVVLVEEFPLAINLLHDFHRDKCVRHSVTLNLGLHLNDHFIISDRDLA